MTFFMSVKRWHKSKTYFEELAKQKEKQQLDKAAEKAAKDKQNVAKPQQVSKDKQNVAKPQKVSKDKQKVAKPDKVAKDKSKDISIKAAKDRSQRKLLTK